MYVDKALQQRHVVTVVVEPPVSCGVLYDRQFPWHLCNGILDRGWHVGTLTVIVELTGLQLFPNARLFNERDSIPVKITRIKSKM